MNNEIELLSEHAKTEFQKKHFQQAVSDFEKCLTLLKDNGDELEIAEMKNNLGVALIRCKEFERAENLIFSTEKIFASHGEISKQGMALANLASAYEGRKMNEEAIKAFEDSIECFKACGEKKLLSITLRNLSDLQLKAGKQFQAVASMQSSYENKTETNLKNSAFKKILLQIQNKIMGK